jgi:uncharacterized protein YndB with AHSA1/START domain
MPTVRRSRSLSAPPEAVWRVVADPQHLPRWWPRVERVEDDDGQAFTQLLRSAKGRAVRADFRRTGAEEERYVAWEQTLEGTPFERLMREAKTRVDLEPDGAGCIVTLTQTQRLRGFSRFAPWLFRRAAREQLNEALDGLERACG